MIFLQVPVPMGHSYLRRYFSAYPGVGTIYAVVARYGNLTSAYVPAVTYACNINNWDIDCIGPGKNYPCFSVLRYVNVQKIHFL